MECIIYEVFLPKIFNLIILKLLDIYLNITENTGNRRASRHKKIIGQIQKAIILQNIGLIVSKEVNVYIYIKYGWSLQYIREIKKQKCIICILIIYQLKNSCRRHSWTMGIYYQPEIGFNFPWCDNDIVVTQANVIIFKRQALKIVSATYFQMVQ